MRLSPFRIRLMFMCLILIPVYFWVAAFRGDRPEQVEWRIEAHESTYLTGGRMLGEMHDRWSHVEARKIDLPGFLYVCEQLDMTTPAPFAGTVLNRTVSIKYWLLTLVSSVPLTAYILWRWRRTRPLRWLQQGRCHVCGYDLRSHAAGQKCPECGVVIEAVSQGHETAHSS
jgi:predicted RNA-binding Zn-ribbon protein involved in translation (DUF1610 family)